MKNHKAVVTTAAIALAALSLTAATKPSIPFERNQRYAFYGDSITHGGPYTCFLQLWDALRHPGEGRTMINCGVAGETQRTCLYRFESDLLAEKPNRVFLVFGMNDVWRCKWNDVVPNAQDAADREEAFLMYRTNTVNTVRRLKALGISPTIVTPFPYDQYSAASAKNIPLCNEPGLATLAKIARQAGLDEQVPVVDTHPVLTDLLRRYPERKFCREDRVHPGRAGHLIIAAEIVRALEGTRPVAEVTINEGTLAKCDNAEVTRLTALPGGGLAFDYRPRSLPFPNLPEVKEVDEVYPFTKDLNRETLRVRGLPAGRWMLVANSNTCLGVYSASEFAAGINLAYLKTPNALAAERAASNLEKLENLVKIKRGALFAKGWLKPDPKKSGVDGFCGECNLAYFRRQMLGEADDRRTEDARRAIRNAARSVKWNVRIVREGTPGEAISSAVPEPPYCSNSRNGMFVRRVVDEIDGRRVDRWWQSCGTNCGYRSTTYNLFLVQHPKREHDGWQRPLYVVLHSAGHDVFDAIQCTRTPGNHDIYRAPADFYALYVDCRIHQDTDWWWGWNDPKYHNTVLAPCERRVIDTIKWTIENYHLDPERVYLSGNSMGGSGTLGIGLRHGDIFAAIKANVPALTQHARARTAMEAPTVPDWLPDPPLCVDYSGGYDGWSRDHAPFIKAMTERKYSLHLFWGPFGHANNTKEILKSNDLIEATDWLSVRKSEVLPVFTRASTDDPSPWPRDFDAKPRTPVAPGQINGFFRWKGSVPTASGFECELALIHAPGAKQVHSTLFKLPGVVTADVTFRRLGAFKVKPGDQLVWTYGEKSGAITVGADGLVTIPQVEIRPVNGRIMKVTRP